MLFGTSAFSETPFSSQTVVVRIVSVTGVQVDTALGSSTITGDAIVTVTGNQVAVALGTPTVRIGKTVPVTGVEATVQLGTDIVVTGGATVSVTGNQLTVSFTDGSQAGSGAITDWSWRFGAE